MKKWLCVILAALLLMTGCQSGGTQGTETLSETRLTESQTTEPQTAPTQTAEIQTTKAETMESGLAESQTGESPGREPQSTELQTTEAQSTKSQVWEPQPTEPQTEPPQTEPVPEQLTVTVSIECHTAVAKGNEVAKIIAPNGVILAAVTVTMEPGASVYDALQQCAGQYQTAMGQQLVIGAKQTAMGVYVYAIQSLAEKACGGSSGWLYRVNGTVHGTSCSNYVLKNGDVIQWQYTCEAGKDLEP